ncbi:hypothetical protein R1sor_008867 [Riccia sorocarpa]|uniref:Peptidase A2 domain-containing protein n=1 Tax=Riccia sorocarpa TaxID=122646 RepID=A0ABD3H4F3_9MARC
MEDVRGDALAKGRGQKATAQEKNKAPAYKLVADIETTTDLKAILEKGILDARVEFSLRDILGIANREFHELIIDVIKRKRQTISEEVATQIAYASDDDVGAAYDADVCVGESEIGEKHVALVAGPATVEADEDDEEKGAPLTSDYRNEFWARATDEVKVQFGGLAEPVTALVDTGSEINVMSHAVFERGQWPIDMQHGWALCSANGVKKMMYGACPNIPVRIGNVEVTQHFFVQDCTPIPIILGQPYITVVRMETKVLNDGSHFARIRSLDDRHAVQFLTKKLEKDDGSLVIPLRSRELYEEVAAFLRYLPHPELECIGRSTECWCNFAHEAEVHAKYKSVLKKVKPVATPLPGDSQQQVELVAKEPELSHEKAFSFSAEEIGCVDPKVIAPMVIFTVPHVPWDLKPIPVPRAMLPKLIDLLKEKMQMGILEPSMAPYSSMWFTVPKKNGSLRFIQDLQPANSVTIRNVGTGPIIDDVVDEFASRAIYSVGDLYSGYD